MTYFGDRHAQAAAEVEQYLCQAYPGTVEASQAELVSAGIGSGFAGWVVPIPGSSPLLFAIDSGFPFSLPRTGFSGRPHLDGTPHVEPPGRLCTFGDSASVDHANPADIARDYLAASLALIEENETDPDLADYSRDFEAYWDRASGSSPIRLKALLDIGPPSREVAAWLGKDFAFIAEDQAAVTRWLTNRYGMKQPSEANIAGLLWCEGLPHPTEYPSDIGGLRALLTNLAPDAMTVLNTVIASSNGRRILILAGQADQSRGAAGAILLDKPAKIKRNRGAGPTKGFRTGKVPSNIASLRTSFIRTNLRSVDATKTRMPGSLFERLRPKRVAVIGCGSLGSGVARQLAKCGVGNLTLFDPENLSWSNIGRHELGAQSIGKNKASELARILKQDLPHIGEVEAFGDSWIEVASKNENLFDDCDLVCSMTADWNAESALTNFQCDRGMRMPFLYAWLERGAFAGHVMVTNSSGTCFRCAFDELGRHRSPLISWLKPEEIAQCSTNGSAYSAVELSKVQALATAMAMDILLERAWPPVHRVWLGSTADVEEAGGTWSSRCIDELGDPGAGGRTAGLNLTPRAECKCRRTTR